MTDTVTRQWLKCRTCERTYDLLPLLYGCPECARQGKAVPVEMAYDLDALDGRDLFAEAGQSRPPSLWRWAPLLPDPEMSPVTLGEGNTPLIPVPVVARRVSIPRVFVKYEGANPTGSFKDRLNTVAISMARRFGFTHATIASSGNQGVSLATYAAVAGMQCVIFCPPYVEERTVKELLFRGVRPVILSDYGAPALALVDELVGKHGWYVSSRNFPRPFANPFGQEGYKTIAFELIEQLGDPPDAVFVPTGGGDSIYGIWKGFRELHQLGLIGRVPGMFACQSEPGGPSVVRAVQQGLRQAVAVPSGESMAISIRTTLSGDHGVWAVQESKGGAAAVADGEIVDALKLLGPAGVAIEPSSAASVAGLLQLASASQLQGLETVVCIGTATAMRWSKTYQHLQDHVAQVPRIHPEVSMLQQVLRVE